jgi:hypothetical protein
VSSLCPRCRGTVRTENIRTFTTFACSNCGFSLSVSSIYRLAVVVGSLGLSLFLASAINLRAYAAIAWIPLLLLAFILLTNFGKFALPPRLNGVTHGAAHCAADARRTEPWKRILLLFLSFWFNITFVALAYGFTLGWAGFLLGGSEREIQETVDLWSLPLGLLSPSFVVTANKTFVTVLGIVFANSFFYAAALTAILTLVNKRVRQPITQIRLSGSVSGDNDNRHPDDL